MLFALVLFSVKFWLLRQYMAQTVLPQLQEISEDLLAQEESLTAQLAEVQEKLRGVRAILPLFGGNSSSTDSFSTDSSFTEESDDEYDDDEPEAPAEIEAPAKETSSAKTEKKAEKKPQASSSAKVSKKKDGRAASWQKYTRPGVKETSIPEAVRLVLETQPDKSFKIAEVMDALFNDSMPKSQHLKARNRISNVLSGGVRSGEWYKGDRGTYRLSAE